MGRRTTNALHLTLNEALILFIVQANPGIHPYAIQKIGKQFGRLKANPTISAGVERSEQRGFITRRWEDPAVTL